MPQLRPAILLLASLAASACAVSFDGYELGPSDASSGTGGAATGGGTGGSVGGGSGGISAGGGSGGSVGGTAGVPSGGNGGTGADGGTGGVPVGGGAAGSTGGGTGGTTGGGTGGGTGGAPVVCPSEGGPMQAVPKTTGGGSYCVDKTEVTQTQYQAFLATSPDSLTQIAGCTGQTFTPQSGCNGWNPVTNPQRPAVCVDWCDAVGFCNFVGKHLCGTIGGGGAVAPASANDAAVDEWYNACSAGGTQNYPYGNLYSTSKCNTLEGGPAHPVDVLSFAPCVGGYAGLNDMSGNVREWTNSCSGSTCMLRGGSWLDTTSSNPYKPDCKNNGMGSKTGVDDRIGFRCCADAD